MKIRKGLVSNSSSSSFVVYYEEDNLIKPEIMASWLDDSQKNILLPSRYGCLYFGWGFERDYDFLSKLNWCFIQANYIKETQPQCLENLEEVLREELDLGITINTELLDDWHTGVDHQSASYEEITVQWFLENKELIRAFIFGEHSYYQGGNDNSDYEESSEYAESLKIMGYTNED